MRGGWAWCRHASREAVPRLPGAALPLTRRLRVSPYPTPTPRRPRRVQPEGGHKGADLIDGDGLPHVGAAIWPGQSYYSAVDKLTGAPRPATPCRAVPCCGLPILRAPPAVWAARLPTAPPPTAALPLPPPPAATPAGRAKGPKLKGEETAVIDQVAVVGAGKDRGFKQANIKLRFNRNPVIGGLWGWGGWILCVFAGAAAWVCAGRRTVQLSRADCTRPGRRLRPRPCHRRQVCVASRAEGRAVAPV